MVQTVVLWPLLFLCLFLHLYLQDLDFIFINKGKFVDITYKTFPKSFISCSFYYSSSIPNFHLFFFFFLGCRKQCVPNIATVVRNLISLACLPPPQHDKTKIASIQFNPWYFCLSVSWYILNCIS